MSYSLRESHGFLMHGQQQSVGTIYRRPVCFRNGDNDLRIAVTVSSESFVAPVM